MFLFAPVAQMAEHLTFNQRVRSSNLRRRTIWFLSQIETVIFIYGANKTEKMELIFFAWFGFMIGIGIMLTICSFGEWGHIPVSFALATLGWIFFISKLI